MPVSLQDIYQARARIAPHVLRTPMRYSEGLSERFGCELHLKLEFLQVTGAFKARGAFNKVLSLDERARKQGVVAVSTGNHGRAVAYAGRQAGVTAKVCLSELVPKVKVEGVKAMGGEVIIHGRSQDQAMVEGRRLVEEEGLTFVSPFDDPLIVAGQGTIGLELLEDLPNLDCALIPLSGGGLIAGIARVLKSANPNIRVIGISMENGAAMHASLEAGKPVEVEEAESLADSLGGGIGLDNEVTFEMTRELVDETVLVSEEDIASAMALAFREERIVAEGSAVVGLSALLAGKLDLAGQRVVTVLSGQNVDLDTFLSVIASKGSSS
ncbi:MAG: hydroxyectoine utilization dehydratase EutB [Rhodovibrionaceae bacterium]|nr:hydroxyectoine utilization dehydratase EutB [Rhodovibrionaceae bacterium]